MRIALYHNLPSGGAKRAVYEWTRRLAATHQIDVYTLSTANHTFCDIRPFAQQHQVFDFTPYPLFESPWGRLNQLQRWRDLGKLQDVGRRIASQINTGGYDIVFAHTCLYTFIPALLQFVQIPTIYYLHEPFGRTYTRQFQRPYLKNSRWQAMLNRFDPLIEFYYRRLENIQLRSIRQTKQLLANSQFTSQQIKIAFNVDAPVCYLGVDVDKFHPMPDIREENTILSVGELSPRKGFDFLIQSLTYLSPDERPKLKLACNSIIPDERDYLQELAAKHEVELQVLTGMNGDELALEYNKAQLCVYSPVLEPFGLVPLEAMACGTPVVGVREGGVQETVVHGHTGLLVERDPMQFAAAIRHLLTDRKLALEYSRNSREHVLCHWTWKDSVTQLENYLYACVGTRPAYQTLVPISTGG